jgi:hypothetical protein
LEAPVLTDTTTCDRTFIAKVIYQPVGIESVQPPHNLLFPNPRK